jgi:microcystin-dependent protein
MSDPFVAEIRIFAGNFAPKGWASCDGQILPLSQNTALFSLLGTQYGGDGKSNFALPNFQGAAPMHTTQYSSSPLGDWPIGSMSGSENVTLLQSELPSHSHFMMAAGLDGSVSAPSTTVAMGKPFPATNAAYQATIQNMVAMGPLAIDATGGGLPHNNMQPYLTLFFIIALQGIFPPRP